MKTKKEKRTQVNMGSATHKDLKTYCEVHGVKIQWAAEKAVQEFLASKGFYYLSPTEL